MANPRNKTTLDSLDKSLANIETFFVVDYQGLTAGQLSTLRKQIREKGGQLIVAKNTLIQRALVRAATSATPSRDRAPSWWPRVTWPPWRRF